MELARTAQVSLHVASSGRADEDNRVITGALALDLIDAGFIVVGDGEASRTEATLDVIVARVGDSISISCTGKETRAAVIDDGPPALVELELRHRVRALVRQTAPRVADRARRVAVADLATDAGDVSEGNEIGDPSPTRWPEILAATLLQHGVSLAGIDHADARVCVVVDADDITAGWGPQGGACVDGGLARSRHGPREEEAAVAEGAGADVADVAVADAVVAALVRLRPAAPEAAAASAKVVVVATPLPQPPPPPPPVLRRLASVDLRLGALGRVLALDPVLGAEVFVPVSSGWGGFGVVDVTGAVDAVLVAEGLVVVGAAWSVDLVAGSRLRVGAGAGLWLHGWRFSDTDFGVAFDPAVALPVSFAVPLTDELGLTLNATAGALTRSRIHRIGSEAVWERGAVFLAISGGLTFDFLSGPEKAPPVENSGGLARGEGG